MKRNKYFFGRIICWVLTVVVLSGCDDYLDESPDDRITLDTLEKASKVVARAYSQASYVFTDQLTDLVDATGNARNAQGISLSAGGNTVDDDDVRLFIWEEVQDINQDTPTFYWNGAYEAIAHANEVLAVIDGIDGDLELRNAIKGEALLSRSYHHFMLVNLFGNHYDENATGDLGVPYITEPEIEFLPIYKRNTVKEVYDLVEKDLLEGLSLVNDRFYIGTKKYHFTVKAAQAFASRFYLWKGDYEKCLQYSNLFLSGSPQSYIKDYATIDGSGFEETAENYGDPADLSNVLVMQQFTIYTRVTQRFGLSNAGFQFLFSGLLDNDIRGDEAFTRGTDAIFVPKLREYFFREDLSSSSGQPYYIAVELKGEEVLLNRAEANLLKAGGDTQLALEDINLLAASRYAGQTYQNITSLRNFYGVATDQEAVLQLILEERKKEFLDQGLRWFDIKRWDIAIQHQLPVSLGGELITLPSGDLRRAIQLPDNALAQGLTPNPR